MFYNTLPLMMAMVYSTNAETRLTALPGKHHLFTGKCIHIVQQKWEIQSSSISLDRRSPPFLFSTFSIFPFLLLVAAGLQM